METRGLDGVMWRLVLTEIGTYAGELTNAGMHGRANSVRGAKRDIMLACNLYRPRQFDVPLSDSQIQLVDLALSRIFRKPTAAFSSTVERLSVINTEQRVAVAEAEAIVRKAS